MCSSTTRTHAESKSETWWILGEAVGGDKYAHVTGTGFDLVKSPDDATPYKSENAARESLALAVPPEFRDGLRVIRFTTTWMRKESCRG